ncbi:MAG: NADH-quinone oxidoreductase subunit NuoH [Dehalococcoidia bacterium]|nr:MAG: NADH-quinone oxidoreductase subunit NuoH [bacterium]MCK6565352.1 NADH-quinone oxidoreductase subunit NuoH [Dehalococcoidia bacterium]NUQ55464.1 NADH-quinone oxidoreductase subunit NuoH [Dehalococcoidia bacterium]RIL04219.1 MAG: NADH-quinone oxidoreductase subunit NuoH [bacterium]
MPAFLITNNWYDFRDLGNLSGKLLDLLDDALPFGVVYVIAALLGFVASFVIFVLPSQLFVGVYGERKLIGRIQSRYGPNRVGPFGLLQPIADAIKLMQKEALTPTSADRALMYLAPIVFVAPCVLLFAVIPFGPNMVFADIPVAIVYFLAVSSIPVLTTFMAGWSHNNKYSLFGAMRVVAMTISYELPLVLGMLGVVLFTATLGLQSTVLWQKEMDIWLVFLQPLAFAIFFLGASAELNRTPTDIAEAESEIVAGYLTEYSGMKWGLFYGMDIGYAIAAAAFGVTVFLGGWTFFGLEKWVPPWLIFIGKTYLFYFLFIWTRGTLPRLRIDQLMTFAWKFMLPIALLNLVIVATERMFWVEEKADDSIVYAFALINIIAAAAAIYGWSRALGYRPENTPQKARLVSEAGGFVPVDAHGEGSK